MNTILLLLIFTGLVGMLLVIFFMLDRLNDLHRQADVAKGEPNPANAFGGLAGKNLWDAMIGIPLPGWGAKQVAALRPRYELVLQKHLELLFEDGKLDGREGFSMPVRCDRKVPTLRGEIESWIPHEFASGVYRAGYALATSADGDQELVHRQLDMLGNAIFSAAGLPPHPLSAILMPQFDRPTTESADEPAEQADAAVHDGEDATQAALPAPTAPVTLTAATEAAPDPQPAELSDPQPTELSELTAEPTEVSQEPATRADADK